MFNLKIFIMRKLLLFTFAMVFGVSFTLAQSQYQLQDDVKSVKFKLEQKKGLTPGTKDLSGYATSDRSPVDVRNQKNSRDLTIKDIGNSANAYSYGYFGGQKTILWVDDNLNTVSHIHRMTSDTYSGNLAMDLSTDGGENFDNNVMIYESNISGGEYNTDAIRYPQGVIYNPEGNTDPNNAKVIFHGPNLDGSNGDTWGGYSFGHASLADYADTSKHLLPADPDNGYYQYIPEAMTMTRDGQFWVVDPADDWTTGELDYTHNLILNKGTYSEADEDITFEQSLLEAPVVDNDDLWYVANEKVAFGPDGQVGYIALLSNDESVPFSEECFYPIIFKTTDGGDSWENMGGVQLGGPDGIPYIVDSVLTDSQIEDLYEPPVPDREEIPYTTAFDFDMVVDNDGDLHIAAVVGVKGSDPYSIATGEDFMAAMDIFTVDGGYTWNAVECRNIKRFRGEFGSSDFGEDNRIQASATMDGEKVFISWLDTDPEFSDEQNNQPDIWTCGVDVENGLHTPPFNVTEFTEAWGAAFFAIAPHYVFDNGDSYEIPFSYEDMDPNDPAQPVQYKYVKGFTISDADFTDTISGFLTDVQKPVFNKANVSQNTPNPFSTTSTIEVNLNKRANLSLEVINMVGQKVLTIDKGEVAAGKKQFTIKAADLKPGIYLYNVRVNNAAVTKKMVVE